MDFALAPGVSAYDQALKRLYRNRAGTTLVDMPFIDTFRSFVAHLNRTAAAHPTKFVMIGSHGDDNAFMQIQFDGGRGPNTTYEDLEASDTNHTCELTDDVTAPRPLDPAGNPIPAFLLIKGCRIGQSQPFMSKMKDALNGASTEIISVTAPNFFHGMTPHPSGVFEYFLYDFKLIAKDDVANRAALIAALVAKNYKDIHNTAITAAQYERWIPARFKRGSTTIQRVRINPTPVPRFTRHSTGRYRYRASTVMTFNIDTSTTPLPAAVPDRITLLKAKLAALAATPGTNPLARTLASTHAFPYYARYGYTSLDNMVDNLFWTFNTQDANNTVAVGKRHEYDINPPMMAAGSTDLIFNYYADAGNRTSSVINFDDRDARFYITT